MLLNKLRFNISRTFTLPPPVIKWLDEVAERAQRKAAETYANPSALFPQLHYFIIYLRSNIYCNLPSPPINSFLNCCGSDAECGDDK
jgi:hypothetical protein